MRAELACCTRVLLDEISDSAMKRRDVAQTYALALRSSELTDWAAVNRAIFGRWSRSGLEWIKAQAWGGKCFPGGAR